MKRVRAKELLAKERMLHTFPGGGDVKVVIGYPNRYWVAMSNLGFQAVYRLFRENPRFAVERAFIPDGSTEGDLISTLETGSQLSQAEILAVSVSFETDYPDVLRLLEAAGVNLNSAYETDAEGLPRMIKDNPTFSKEVRHIRPLIVGGGASLTLNPEPLANLFDAIAIGEGEGLIEEIGETYLQARADGVTFDELLVRLSRLDGIYVPSLYRPRYRDDDTIEKVEAAPHAPIRPRRRYIKNIDEMTTATVIQTSETEFRSMYMTETGRGCEVGCKFCVAGYMYRPTRKRSAESIKQTVKIGLENAESIGFVGAAVSSHPQIADLARSVAEQGKRAALSSIMSQRVTPELAASLSESEYKTVALAPEAGGEALRFRIGKRVLDDQLVAAVKTLARSGVRNFKLYFMVGLPSETIDDVKSIINLVERVQGAALDAAKELESFAIAPKILMSVNPFIPKAWTPFQRHSFLGFREIKDRLALLRRGVGRIPNVEMNAEAPKESYFQVLMSRGDRRVGDLLIDMHKAKEDWKFLVQNGGKIIRKGVPAPEFYVLREFGEMEFLPWEVIDLRLKRTLLEREYRKTFDDDVTPLLTRARRALDAGEAIGLGVSNASRT